MINPQNENTTDSTTLEQKYTRNFDDIEVTLFKIRKDVFGVQKCYKTTGFFDGIPSKECFGRKSSNINGCGFIYDKEKDDKLLFFKTYPLLFTFAYKGFFKPTLSEIFEQLPESALDTKKLYISADIDNLHEFVTMQTNRHLGIVTIAYPLNEINGNLVESADGTLKHIDQYTTCHHKRTRDIIPIVNEGSSGFIFNQEFRYSSHSEYDDIYFVSEKRRVEPEIVQKINESKMERNMFAVAVERDDYSQNNVNPLDVIPDKLLSDTKSNYVYAFPYWLKLEPSNCQNAKMHTHTTRNVDLFGGILWIIHINTEKDTDDGPSIKE